MKELKTVLPEADAATAFKWLNEEKARTKAGVVSVQRPQQRFADYAVSLLERKVKKLEIRSARSRERWRYTLEHLIGGTSVEEGRKHVPGFGECFLDMLRPAHIETWKEGIGDLISAGHYRPTTANGWLSKLKVITKAAKRELGLAIDPAEDVTYFDTSEHETYTAEEPNSLSADEARSFAECMRDEFPQHFAMMYLGLALGLRPSSLRPLRRRGASPDVLWDEGVILVRRSHTLGEAVMNTTKNKWRQRINIPEEVMDVLRWHVDTQRTTSEQQDSELLFPAEDGGFRSESCLKKPFAAVRGLIGLKKKLTPRGLRRTFNDLARAAQVESLVTKSISGHLTERMKEHYSTVSPVEQREGIGRLLRLVRSPNAVETSGGAHTRGGAQRGPGGAQRRSAAS